MQFLNSVNIIVGHTRYYCLFASVQIEWHNTGISVKVVLLDRKTVLAFNKRGKKKIQMTLEDTQEMTQDELRQAFLPLSKDGKDKIKADIRSLDFITIKQVMLLLDFQYSFETIRTWVNNESLPRTRLGGDKGAILIKITDFDEFLKNGYKRAN